ncbi:MAG: UDP-3-O-acyl-N-acetylglucosamine deacetylase [Candidatus Anammoxibacter sp.]
MLGDLYLSNITLCGHIIAKRSGHFLNIRMARKLAEIANNI